MPTARQFPRHRILLLVPLAAVLLGTAFASCTGATVAARIAPTARAASAVPAGPMTPIPDPADAAAAVTTLRRVAAATTADEFCALLSRGFATYLGDGTPARCADLLVSQLWVLPHGRLVVVGTGTYRTEVLVEATIVPSFPQRTTYYFVREEGTWRLHSIGIFKAPDAGIED